MIGDAVPLSDTPADSLYSVLSHFASDAYTGHKWLKIRDHIGSVCDAVYRGSEDQLTVKDLAIAKVHLGVGLCLLFVPTYQLDPLEVKKAEIEFFKLMVCIHAPFHIMISIMKYYPGKIC